MPETRVPIKTLDGGANVRGIPIAMLLLAFAGPSASESSIGTGTAAAYIAFKVNVPPLFKILKATPVAGGLTYRVWTNMKSIVISGKKFRFTRVGEAPLFVPSSNETFIVYGL